MTKLGAEERLVQEVQAACGAVLAQQHEDGSWTGEPAEPPGAARGLPPELVWLAPGPLATRVPRAILAGRRLPWTPLRGNCHARCVNWLLDHLEEVDPSLGVAALEALRFPSEHRALATLKSRRSQTATARATAEAVICLQEAGLPPDHAQVQKAVDWLRAHPVRQEAATTRVLLALNRSRQPNLGPLQESIRGQMQWLLSQQRPDGSWEDTAAVLETLRWYGYTAASPRIQRALRSLGAAPVEPPLTAAEVERQRAALPRVEAVRTLAIQLQRQGLLTAPQTAFR